MPSNKTVAVVIVYTSKNTIDALLLFLNYKRERKKKKVEEKK